MSKRQSTTLTNHISLTPHNSLHTDSEDTPDKESFVILMDEPLTDSGRATSTPLLFIQTNMYMFYFYVLLFIYNYYIYTLLSDSLTPALPYYPLPLQNPVITLKHSCGRRTVIAFALDAMTVKVMWHFIRWTQCEYTSFSLVDHAITISRMRSIATPLKRPNV